MQKLNTTNWKVWPHLTVVALIFAVLAAVAVGWWVRHEQSASAAALPNAARIQRVDGDVALNNSDVNADAADTQWVEATPNQPFTVGDRIYTRDNSHASLAFTGRNFARLNPNTSLDVLSLADRRTQLALRDGSAMFDVGYLAPGELFEVATPYGAVDLQQPGLYDVGFDNGNVVVSVLSGLAQVVGLGGSGQINKGEMLRLLGQTAADVVLSRVDGRNAGYLVDDYYGNQYPQYYDGRYRDYTAYLNDPYYFDPYRRTSSYQYVNSYIPGVNDLDYYGNWQNLNGYGYAWSPRVNDGWAPYQQGYWMNDYPYGPTWVSNEPWGYAPYHYGRWANVGNQWYWIPDQVNNTATYSPAMVAFVPLSQDEIGWVPLGPGDQYAPRYYNNDWSPYYLSRTQIVQPRVANLYVPGAVTVVPIDDFTRGDWRRARRADRQMLGNVNPVLDPLTLTPLRNAAIHSAWGRGKKDIPPGIAKKLRDTTVVTSITPVAPPFRRELGRNMRVESVNERFGSRKFKVKDERGDNSFRDQRGNNGDQGNKGAVQSAQAPNQIRLDDQTPGNGRFKRLGEGRSKHEQQQRVENATRQTQVPVRQPHPQVERAQGERVGNRMKTPDSGIVRPREPRFEQKPKQPVQRSQQPVEMQRGNPGHGHSEMKQEKKQGGPPAPNPQQQGGGKGGGGKGKGHKP
jgi:hypothetical protein